MKIQIVIGSTRTGRIAERVAKWVANSATGQPNFEVELVDLANYDMPYFDEAISPQFNRDRQPSQRLSSSWIRFLRRMVT